MRTGGWQLGVMALAASAVLVGVGSPARGQATGESPNGRTPAPSTSPAPQASAPRGPSLPADIYTAKTISSHQLQLIQNYVTQWSKPLREADGAGQADSTAQPSDSQSQSIVYARQQLLQPFSFNPSDAFLAAYSTAASNVLKGTLDSKNLMARLNVMIIASHLNLDQNVVDLIDKGLADASPAVRYWAVKAVGNTAGSASDPNLQQQMLTQMTKVLNTESSTAVLEQALKAMVSLDLPNNAAIKQVLAALNQRVALHTGHPRMSLRPEISGLQALYKKMFTLRAQQGGGMADSFGQLARAAMRYMALAADQLAKTKNPTPALQEDHAAMIQFAFVVLTQVHDQFNSPVNVPTSIRLELAQKKWQALADLAGKFRPMLAAAPFNLPADQLKSP